MIQFSYLAKTYNVGMCRHNACLDSQLTAVYAFTALSGIPGGVCLHTVMSLNSDSLLSIRQIRCPCTEVGTHDHR